MPASGTADALAGVIVLRIDDTVGTDVDPELRGLVVVFNSSSDAVRQVVPGMAGQAATLSPIQPGGSDPVVRSAAWDFAESAATVPARTVAVLVQR